MRVHSLALMLAVVGGPHYILVRVTCEYTAQFWFLTFTNLDLDTEVSNKELDLRDLAQGVLVFPERILLVEANWRVGQGEGV